MIKWEEAKAREQKVMIRARQIAKELNLNMKIGDVEFRGDNNKAIFYYIADDRVDFRELIKLYAKEFAIKIEMKQIGARQEAGRIGGIGSCGRALCCSTWRTDFSSVTSDAAIKQGLSPNAEKMAGAMRQTKMLPDLRTRSLPGSSGRFPARVTGHRNRQRPGPPFQNRHPSEESVVQLLAIRRWTCFCTRSGRRQEIPEHE